MTEQKDILNILNPVRIYKVKELMSMVDIIGYQEPFFSLKDLLSRYESLTSAKLEKKHFVPNLVNGKCGECGQEPDGDNECPVGHNLEADLIFEGFETAELSNSEAECVGFGNLKIWFFTLTGYVEVEINNQVGMAWQSWTIADLISDISRYNRTASTKIQLRYSESFAKRLVG